MPPAVPRSADSRTRASPSAPLPCSPSSRNVPTIVRTIFQRKEFAAIVYTSMPLSAWNEETLTVRTFEKFLSPSAENAVKSCSPTRSEAMPLSTRMSGVRLTQWQ